MSSALGGDADPVAPLVAAVAAAVAGVAAGAGGQVAKPLLQLPRYCDKMTDPSLDKISTDAGAAAMVIELKTEVLAKHRKHLEAHAVVSEKLYEKIIADLCWLIVERFRKPGGVESIKSMADAFAMLPDLQLETFDIKTLSASRASRWC